MQFFDKLNPSPLSDGPRVSGRVRGKETCHALYVPISQKWLKTASTPSAHWEDRGLGPYILPITRLAPKWPPTILETEQALGSVQSVAYIMYCAAWLSTASFIMYELWPLLGSSLLKILTKARVEVLKARKAAVLEHQRIWIGSIK